MKERFKKVNLDGSISITMDRVKGVWNADKRSVISAMVGICEEYKRDRYTLTLRQLYYQLVARDIIPNHDKVYKKMSGLKDEAVYGGLIDWGVFEDRGRVPHTPYYENGVAEALERTIECYRLDRQENQNVHVEVWTEKDAISSILKRVTDKYGITLVVNKGYTSSTAIYGAYERFTEKINHDKKVKILYFGDHDPSGLDMVRDIRERLMFMFINGEQLDSGFQDQLDAWWVDESLTLCDVAEFDEKYESVTELMRPDLSDYKHEKIYPLFDEGRMAMFFHEKGLFEVQQIGLTMEQIEAYNPPHNPAKITDPRAKNYVKKYGAVSWEVDALKPNIMQGIVKDAIEQSISMETYDFVLKQERKEKGEIQGLIDGLDKDEE